MRDLIVRDARKTDAWVIVGKLRDRDRHEAEAAAGGDVLATVQSAVERSAGLCWAAENAADGLVLLLGCSPTHLGPNVGSPWLLGAEAAALYPGALTRIAKQHIAVMLQTYDTLVNYVDERNVASVRWLDRLGFRLEAPTPYGIEGRPFHRFSMGA